VLLQQRLVERQRDLGYRDGQMARTLGIPRTTYSSIKVQRNKISLAVARKIVAAFPDLAPYALLREDEAGE
jgi:DNA-binding XRE family transcriptional regulator